ncbi:MAG: hypothetical protein DK306_001089 [Chloroflexi bacterium]|jgi:hypothetical protein|nr:MAG: hypothetical protein DK306_001089 [Chloroflexota bacterium]
MDLYDAALALQRAQDHYLCWREMHDAVTALPSGGAVPPWVNETVASMHTDAELRDRDQAALWLAASESRIRLGLRDARVEHWYQQGKALRYALILCRNRLEGLARQVAGSAAPTDPAPESHDAAQTPDLADAPAALELLREQVGVLGVEIAAWESRRRPVERVCSLRDLQAILADPRHPADKQQLESVVARATSVSLPPSLPCVQLRWDAVSGQIDRADVVAAEGLEDAPPTNDSCALGSSDNIAA